MTNFRLKKYGPLGNYYICWSEGRRSKRQSTHTSDYELAKQRCNELALEVLRPKDARPQDVMVEAVLRRYYAEHGSEVRSLDTSKRAVDRLIARYKDKSVAEINISSIKEYERDLRKQGLANSTINRLLSVLKAALKHSVKNGELKHAPHIPTLATARPKERWLTRDEAAQLLRACRGRTHQHLALFIRLGLYTGARHQAILQLTWDRVDLETGRIDYRLPGEPETKKRRPHAPVRNALLTTLRRARKNADGKYVVSHRGKPLKSIKGAFRGACKRAGLKGVTPHTLKHTYITWLLRAGVSVWRVSGLTATSPATIQKVYGHHIQDDLREAANSV